MIRGKSFGSLLSRAVIWEILTLPLQPLADYLYFRTYWGKRELEEEKRIALAFEQVALEEMAKEEECKKLKQKLADLESSRSS
jgi:hypothetical protein